MVSEMEHMEKQSPTETWWHWILTVNTQWQGSLQMLSFSKLLKFLSLLVFKDFSVFFASLSPSSLSISLPLSPSCSPPPRPNAGFPWRQLRGILKQPHWCWFSAFAVCFYHLHISEAHLPVIWPRMSLPHEVWSVQSINLACESQLRSFMVDQNLCLVNC